MLAYRYFRPSFYPKEVKKCSIAFGRSSDLPVPCAPFPSRYAGQWILSIAQGAFCELTAAGTVAEFHGIPFSFYPQRNGVRDKNQMQDKGRFYFPKKQQCLPKKLSTIEATHDGVS